MNCKHCKSTCIKYGKQKTGVQRWRCLACLKTQQEKYTYQAKLAYKLELVPRMIINNSGFRGIGRVLGICVPTIMKILYKKVSQLVEPKTKPNGVYQVDELQAYKKKGKDIWAVYAVEKQSGKVIGINVGKRDKTTIRKTVNKVLQANPKRVYTDGYKIYPTLLPPHLHKKSNTIQWKIERKNLDARNSLKMLNRRTLSYVKKTSTFLACLQLLFWS